MSLGADSDEAQLITVTQEYNQSKNIKKVSLVIEMVKSKAQCVRLFCAKRFFQIGEILGINRIEDELIPFITDLILNFEDNEEILTEFSNQLLNLLLLLHKNGLFSLIGTRSLEILSGNDDEIVRQTSIDNLCKFIQVLDEEKIRNEIFPLMRRLIENDSKTKMSCCYLFPFVYPKLQDPEIKKELIQVYYEISHDESPSVRRAAADNIKHFCKVNSPEVLSELVKLYCDFIKDPVDIVKIYTIESTQELLQKVNNEQKEKLIMQFTSTVSNEKSWRVKYSSSECICEMCKLFDKNFNEQKFAPILMLYLKDKEPEVKCSVLSNFDKFLEHISLDKFKESFLQIFEALSSDQNLHVREVYSTSLLKCIKFLKSDDQLMINKIMPLLTQLLKDEVNEVQNAAIMNISELILLANNDKELMDKCIMPILNEGIKNTKWRFRYFIAENFLKIITQIPSNILREKYTPIIISFFNDNAKDIKELAWKILEEIATKVDSNFLKDKIWDVQKDKFSSNNYIMRIASMKSIDFLKEHYTKDFIRNTAAKEIMQMGRKDKVPNVKFSSFKVLKSISIYLKDKTFIKEVIAYINEFTSKADEDRDVLFFGNQTKDELEKMI